MATTDERDPVLIPSLPEPWEGLVREVVETAGMSVAVGLWGDFPEIVKQTHTASRAEKALRVALLDLLRGGKTGP